ncbi:MULTISPECIES: hypothetical protein [Microcystis]|uniref:hypothetical protein n=1 Tax=Microcystis TaxID=1125 RepID=UPI000D12F816|nr:MULTISPECIES: hypothetical protein [Microcystis]AVQ73889.1 hypothetical protein B5D77_23715 [Microcystis sp. MC19]GCA89851.1 hypothetical protein MiTa_03204 [Microcystis aeruginosa NIES-4264]
MTPLISIERLKSKQTISRIPYISYHSLFKAISVIHVSLRLYCPIYNISDDEFFEFSPLLALVESLIYETDIELESNPKDSTPLTQRSLWNSKKIIIQSFLKEFDLENPRILNHMENLGEYIELESQLVASEKITLEDVIRASELRSSDLRIIHTILVQMSGKSYRAEIFEILSPTEILSEFQDDFCSYKRDVAAGNYNTYWMFQKLYGEEAHHYLKAEIDRYKNLFEEKLKLFPEEEQERYTKKWSRFWKRYSYLSSAELIRQVALEGVENNE